MGQNPEITVTPTSPFLDLLCFTNMALNKVNEQYTFDFETISKNIYKSVYEGFYKNIKTKYVLDKHRGHPRNVDPWRLCLNVEPKIICTVRPIADILASYIRLIEQNPENNFVDEFLKKHNKSINTSNRANCLWEEFISDPYQSMVIGLKNYRKCLHIVEYDLLVSRPTLVLDRIYRFLGIEEFVHNFHEIENFCSETKDTAWGLKNLHDIRPKLEKTSKPASDILGHYLTDLYNQYNLVYS